MLHGIGCHRGIVVEQEEEVRLPRGRDQKRSGHGTGKPDPVSQSDASPGSQDLVKDLRGAVGRGVVHRQYPDPRVRLAGQTGESLSQPWGGVPDDDDDQDAGDLIGHDGCLAFQNRPFNVQKGGSMCPPSTRAGDGYLRLAVVRLAVDFLRAAVLRGRRAALVRFRAVLLLRVERLAVLRLAVLRFLAVDFLAVDFLRRVAAPFRAAVERLADFRLRVAAPFLAAADLFADEVFLRAVDLLRVAAICHLLSKVRTPCASGVAAPAR